MCCEILACSSKLGSSTTLCHIFLPLVLTSQSTLPVPMSWLTCKLSICPQGLAWCPAPQRSSLPLNVNPIQPNRRTTTICESLSSTLKLPVTHRIHCMHLGCASPHTSWAHIWRWLPEYHDNHDELRNDVHCIPSERITCLVLISSQSDLYSPNFLQGSHQRRVHILVSGYFTCYLTSCISWPHRWGCVAVFDYPKCLWIDLSKCLTYFFTPCEGQIGSDTSHRLVTGSLWKRAGQVVICGSLCMEVMITGVTVAPRSILLMCLSGLPNAKLLHGRPQHVAILPSDEYE